MSVIQTIRNKYGKIAGAVIAIALVGFIVSDARNGSFGNFFGGHDNNVMVVNGRKIEPKEYQVRLKEFETLYSMFNKNRALDDATRAQMNEQVVQTIVEEAAIEEQCDKLGIQTSEEEKKEMIYGNNPDPLVRQFQLDGNQVFINQETKQFDPSIVKYLEKELAEHPEKIDPSGKIKEQWETVKSYVKRQSRVNKYKSLFAGVSNVPAYAAKRAVMDQGSMAAIRYVKVPFTMIPDDQAKPTDEELKAYMSKHQGLFKTDQETRSMEYVSFEIVPSAADTQRVLNALGDLRAEFASTKDNKTFVNGKTDDVNSFTEAYMNKKTFMSRYADTLMTLPVGEIYGPYFENGGYKLTKITDKKTLPDSSKIRHILVKTKDRGNDIRTDSAAKMRIDSAIALLKSGAKFDSVVSMYSDDDGSKKTAGEYTFTLMQRPSISKEFGDFAFEGTGSKTVKVANEMYAGYHYIEVLEQKGTAPTIQMATVAKSLAPSDSTNQALYGKANEFASKNTTAEAFDATVKKENLDKRVGDNVKVNNFTVTGLGPCREVIRWMYEHKVGEVSNVFQIGEQRYVVAKLTAVTEKGAMTITSANRPMLEQKVKEEKKADAIMKKFASPGSLDAIAQAAGTTVAQSDSVMLSGGFIPGLGYEPKVVGYSFCQSFQPNTVSPGIKGQGGVYFVTVLSRTAAPLPDGPMLQQLVMQQRNQQEMQVRNSIGQQLQQAIIKKADVNYHPANF